MPTKFISIFNTYNGLLMIRHKCECTNSKFKMFLGFFMQYILLFIADLGAR